MDLWIVSLSHFLHISATVVWIGGIFMTLLVILPGSKAALESAPLVGKLMKEIGQRFTPLANMSILILIVSGLPLLYANRNSTSFGDPSTILNFVIFYKLAFVAVMVCIHLYRGSILNKKIIVSATQGNEEKTAGLRKLSLDLVRINLILGIAVLLLTAVLISS
ncbi:MAG: hypothetical protein VR65_17635 [Desulfobulbaceae bacterium BRH_c16a]|nr:MAG: hypothetical protein VR65_17635 [Desulfobulbaceae bacterium BRH_c16a]